jgi:translation initiation factor 2B subunit (eIF-2B alpha/beta/delta family)
LRVQNFEKAKLLLKRAYKLKKKCLISPEVTRKLRDVLNVIRSEKEIKLSGTANRDDQNDDLESNEKLNKIYEKLGDSYCNLGLYELGLTSYQEQVFY